MNIEYADEISLETLFGFIASLGNVKDITKQSKLRVVKAILNRMFDNRDRKTILEGCKNKSR